MMKAEIDKRVKEILNRETSPDLMDRYKNLFSRIRRGRIPDNRRLEVMELLDRLERLIDS